MLHRIDENGYYIGSYTSEYKYFKTDWVLIDVELPSGVVKAFWNGSEWIEVIEEPTIVVPSIITARQLRLQLVLNGFDLNTIDLIIDSLPEPDKSIAKVSWEYATVFEREHQMLALIAQQLGITETELDTIFINAEKL